MLLIAAVATLALAGCQTGSPVDHGSEQPDPETDQLGWESGYWHDDPVPVTESDGLNESEREAVVARSMARVEEIRHREFEDDVRVTVASREAVRDRSGGDGHSRSATAFYGQVWEAPFLLGEGTDPFSVSRNYSADSVGGYYDAESDEIVVVGNSSMDVGTLAHELAHALQDQHYDVWNRSTRFDAERARSALVEGDAELVEERYRTACGDRWSCVGSDDGGGVGDVLSGAGALACSLAGCSGGPGDHGEGYRLMRTYPYDAGTEFVADAYDDDSWNAVDRRYGDLPESSEQISHPDAYPDERPADVTVGDRSTGEWSRWDHEPRTATLGEAAIAAMAIQNGVSNRTGDYRTAASTGWAGDALVPYRNGSGGYGYVWRTVWDSQRDAIEFTDAYTSILTQRGNETGVEGVYVLPESDPYGDAFRVRRNGTRVTIVNAPTRDDLGAVHSAS